MARAQSDELHTHIDEIDCFLVHAFFKMKSRAGTYDEVRGR
jgi:hypothetical protein